VASVLIVRPHFNLGSATFFADYDCTGTPNCARIPQSLYYGGGISVLFAPSLPLPKPWRPFVGFDVSVLTRVVHVRFLRAQLRAGRSNLTIALGVLDLAK
jgi:hypothetical protein